MINDCLYQSRSEQWETPQYLFDELNQEFSFDLDACAIEENAKCERYISPAQDGLLQPWNGRVFCNPPYGKEIAKWIEKAQKEIHTNPKTEIVVLLIHARTDTKWFHDFLYNKSNVELRFLRGRLKFGESKNNAPFPSMIAVLRKP